MPTATGRDSKSRSGRAKLFPTEGFVTFRSRETTGRLQRGDGGRAGAAGGLGDDGAVAAREGSLTRAWRDPKRPEDRAVERDGNLLRVPSQEARFGRHSSADIECDAGGS